jgi:hypothetical protein
MTMLWGSLPGTPIHLLMLSIQAFLPRHRQKDNLQGEPTISTDAPKPKGRERVASLNLSQSPPNPHRLRLTGLPIRNQRHRTMKKEHLCRAARTSSGSIRIKRRDFAMFRLYACTGGSGSKLVRLSTKQLRTAGPVPSGEVA